MSIPRSLAAAAALALTAFAAAACADDRSPTQALGAADAPHASMSSSMSSAHMGATTGTTGGWADGRTVTFFYNRPFFCQEPPSSEAPSGCEVGAESETAPRGGPIPVLYVMTPLGFTPPASELQCPTAGACINHPSTLDLSRIGLPASFPLPPHSHIVGREDGSANANAGWWEIEVVGVKDQATWNAIVAGKSLETVRALQAADPTGARITGDIPSNLYLFFGVRR